MATETQLQFINRVGIAAKSDMQSSGILASLTIAQAIQESGWGTSTLATKANALFGIKASSGWTGATYTVNTQEYKNGSYATISSTFRAYNSWEDSIKGHSDFLLANSRYAGVIGLTDYTTACNAIYAAGYATDPNYPTRLIDHIETYKLYEWDEIETKNIEAGNMNLKQLSCNITNYRTSRTDTIKYIVVHYTAGNGDSALNNATYFSKNPNLSASAHYFVDENEIYQSVDDANTAWHCGSETGSYKHALCRNANSIGIEMCSRKDSSGNYYIKDETVDNTIELVLYLMEKYNIPLENVVRHYDVTGKSCPEPFVRKPVLWTSFKENLEDENMTQEKFNEYLNVYLADIAKKTPSSWSLEARTWAESIGLIVGNEYGEKQYKTDCTREQMVQFLYRFKDLVK